MKLETINNENIQTSETAHALELYKPKTKICHKPQFLHL